MVRINNYRLVKKLLLAVKLIKQRKILIVIIRYGFAVLVYSTSEYSVSKRISACVRFPASVYKSMACLRRTDRIEHYRHSSAGWIFHSHRYIKSACSESVLLILDRARTDSNI